MPASFPEILLGYEHVETGNGLHQAILCRSTGKIYFHSEFSDLDEFSDALPDDVEDEEKYLAIPASGNSASASHWCWILRTNFCLMTSTRSDTCSASAAPTRNFEPC